MTATGTIGSGMENHHAHSADMVAAPFGQALVRIAEHRPDIIALTADLARYTDLLPFVERFPDRFINVGMAEQNLIGIAAGLAAEQFTPIVTTYCVFATRRAHDFIAIQVALMNRNVKIVAGLPGLTTSYGGTHQGIEDLALIRAIPGMTVLDPADARELAEATEAMLEMTGPVYMRLQRGIVRTVLGADVPPFEIGRLRELRAGSDVAIVACGVMVERSLEAAVALEPMGISASVVGCATLKPIDGEGIRRLAAAFPAIVTAENHTVVGGLYSAIAEIVVRESRRAIVEPVAIDDQFCGYGSPAWLVERHGLGVANIVAATLKAMERA